jgi:amino acid transporter
VASAGVVAFYAFLGFEDMVNVAEEVHEVKRTLPKGILLTLLITTLLYVLLATVAVLTVPPDALGTSDAPLAQVYEVSGGRPEILAGIALLAMLNGALIQVVKASRVVYGLADQGGLPRRLARVHPGRRTPLLATALATLAAGLLALFVPLEALATLTSLITLTTFALADLALVVVKRRDPSPPGVRTWPIWIPATGGAASVAFAGFEVLRRIA